MEADGPTHPTLIRSSRTFRVGDRLRSKLQFDRAYQEGRRLSGRFLTFVAIPNGIGRAHLGISAGRRLGGAPVRNRLKRRVRELFRLNPGLRSRGVDLVIGFRDAAVSAGATELKQEFDRLAIELSRRLRLC